jgi:carboxymethylenebutenolidase
MNTEILEFDTPDGPGSAYVAIPDNMNADTKAVVVIHEWWGLNDYMKGKANDYAAEGFIAIAPDLYRGKTTKDPEEASRLMHGLAIEDGLNTVEAAMTKARETYGIHHFGITGYCMGGTFALWAACEMEGISAAAPFYGDIPDESILKNLKVPTVFVSGIHDVWITPEKVAGLEAVADKYELPVDSLKYDADHAFCNSTRPEVYNEAAAKDAWAKVVGFFADKL